MRRRVVKACCGHGQWVGEAGDAGKAAEEEMLASPPKRNAHVGPNSKELANFHNRGCP